MFKIFVECYQALRHCQVIAGADTIGKQQFILSEIPFLNVNFARTTRGYGDVSVHWIITCCIETEIYGTFCVRCTSTQQNVCGYLNLAGTLSLVCCGNLL